MDDGRTGQLDGPRKKPRRPRALLACKACRARKAKCERSSLDAQCTSCLRLGVPCIDESSTLAHPPSILPTSPQQQQHSHGQHAQHPPQHSFQASPIPPIPSSSSTNPPQSALYTSGDAMGGLSSWGEDSGQPLERPFFGPSASLSFFDRIRTAILSSSYTTSQNDPFRSVPPPNQEDKPLGSFESVDPYALPPKQIADDLVLSFLWSSNSVLHILHAPSFMAEYQRLWTHQIRDMRFLTLVNMAFALGATFRPTLTPDASASQQQGNNVHLDSETYFIRARQIYAFNLSDDTSLRTVQILILIAHYSQSRLSPSRCWNTLGLAARMAIGIGLHHELPNSSSCNQILSEERKRAYWACMNLDIVMSMTLGRPTMLAGVPVTIGLPVGIDDEYIQPTRITAQPSNVPSQTALFVQSIKLYQILSDVLTKLYRPPEAHNHIPSCSCSCSSSCHKSNGSHPESCSKNNHPTYLNKSAQDIGSLQSMLELEERLDQWVAQVPPHLAINADTSNHWANYQWVLRHQHIMHCRYLNVRVLLFRPSLTNLLNKEANFGSIGAPSNSSGTPPSSFRERLCRTAAQLCLEAAKEQIDILHNTTVRHAGAPWFTTLYIFTACGVLLASRWNDTVDQATFNIYWNRAREVLLRYTQNYPNTQRSLHVLDLVFGHMLTADSSSSNSSSSSGVAGAATTGAETSANSPKGGQDVASQLDRLLGTELDPFGSFVDLWPWRLPLMPNGGMDPNIVAASAAAVMPPPIHPPPAPPAPQ